ncbi:metal ABC transporter ATP-binding protein [Kushneria phosphatilytica]|uniref:ABC transporter ATP-binding protein n=1 Tax=Kushneria phosphatilytica TaxID=657387 RepID=A0A1S1NYJ2_9GAMM|nr:ABC transporter ATP-binding protein [Kushneria phosphatilytica]OHV11923.1 ABC transporter [Kushneria phosphatilytica]QEL11105.1 ABC transporter ATP-binding protein [Kushneria phosphatilytica]
MESAIDLEHVSLALEGQSILEDVSLSVPHKQFLGLIGPNGGGKSTLLRLMLGLLRPDTGQVRLLGRSPRQAAHSVGYVPQFTRFTRSFPISVEDVVLMGQLGHGRWWGPWRRRDRRAVDGVLATLEIESLRHRRIEGLSGGQMQRVLIARALACQPSILLLDEPTASVDTDGERALFDLFARLRQDMTIVLISHDLGFVSDHVDRVVCLNRTLVDHTAEPITADTIAQLYGQQVRMVHHHH